METDGTLSVVGSGFGLVYDLIFGDDDCLYLTEFANDRVLRIEPLPQLAIHGGETGATRAWLRPGASATGSIIPPRWRPINGPRSPP